MDRRLTSPLGLCVSRRAREARHFGSGSSNAGGGASPDAPAKRAANEPILMPFKIHNSKFFIPPQPRPRICPTRAVKIEVPGNGCRDAEISDAKLLISTEKLVKFLSK